MKGVSEREREERERLMYGSGSLIFPHTHKVMHVQYTFTEKGSGVILRYSNYSYMYCTSRKEE